MAINTEKDPMFVSEMCGRYPGTFLVTSSNFENYKILKKSDGALFSVHGYSSNGVVYIQLFDSFELPVVNSKPFFTQKINSKDNFDLSIPPGGFIFKKGICICMSSTPDTLNLVSGNGFYITAVLK